MSNSNKIGNAFFERGSWHHRFKVLNEEKATKTAVAKKPTTSRSAQRGV